jgi:hypothetical protein
MRLTFNRYAPMRAFRSPADFARFADGQQAKFAATRGNGSDDHEWWGNSLAQNWAAAAAAARDPEADQAVIQRPLTAQPVFPFESRLVPVLEQITRLNQARAAKSIIGFLKGDHDGNAANHVHVMTLNAFSQFHTALALETLGRTGAEQKGVEANIQSHEERLASLFEADAAEIEAQRASFNELIDEARGEHAGLSEHARKLIKLGQEHWQKAYSDFIEQLATETAVKLWSDRSIKHETRYKGFRKWTLIFGGIGLAATLVWIFAGFAAARWAFPDDKTAQIASYTAGSVALFTLFVWGLRVLIRSMMSEDHLATDASARSALAHTYLALTKEEAATPEDRAIILATLFAPVSDGLVKDDGMPVFSPTAYAAQMLTK